MSESDPGAPGLLGSLRRLLDTGLETIHNRIELFGVELREEQGRFVGLLLKAAIGLFLGTVGGVVVTVAIALAFPGRWRLVVMLVLGIGYLAGAALIFLHLRKRLRQAPPPFVDSLNQLKKDREWLKSIR